MTVTVKKKSSNGNADLNRFYDEFILKKYKNYDLLWSFAKQKNVDNNCEGDSDV